MLKRECFCLGVQFPDLWSPNLRTPAPSTLQHLCFVQALAYILKPENRGEVLLQYSKKLLREGRGWSKSNPFVHSGAKVWLQNKGNKNEPPDFTHQHKHVFMLPSSHGLKLESLKCRVIKSSTLSHLTLCVTSTRFSVQYKFLAC